MVSPVRLKSPADRRVLEARRSRTVAGEEARPDRARSIGGGDALAEGAKVGAARPWKAKIGLCVAIVDVGGQAGGVANLQDADMGVRTKTEQIEAQARRRK